ncbi:MAG: hypothetical protein WAV93_06450, partial [Bacteroidales bacterium]
METSAPVYRYKLATVARLLGFIALMFFLKAYPAFSQTSTCVPLADNEKLDPWSPECYLTDNCTFSGNPCQAGDVIITRVYVGDINGDPITPFCPDPGSAELYLWATFEANATRYAIRTYYEVFDENGFVQEYNIPTAEIITPGTHEILLTPGGAVTLDCEHTYEIKNVWVAWETVSSTLAEIYSCEQYSPAKCSSNTGSTGYVLIIPSFDYSCGSFDADYITVNFTGSATGGSTMYTYEWDFDNDGFFDDGTGDTPSYMFNTTTTGDFTVTLKVADALDPSAYGLVTVVLHLPHITECPGPYYACSDDTNPIQWYATATPDGGTGVYYYISGGTYYSAGEITQFVPSLAGVGTHSLKYEYSYGGCTDVCYFNIVVYQTPTVTCPADQNVNFEDDPITLANLTGISPSGGVFTYNNTPITEFDPETYGGGDFLITYTVTDTHTGTNCSASCTFNIHVSTCSLNITCPTSTATVACHANIPEAITKRTTTEEELLGLGFIITDFCETLYLERAVSTVPDCEGIVTVTYTISDGNGNSQTCIVTYTIDYSGGLTAPDNESSTVSCPSEAVDPGAPDD